MPKKKAKSSLYPKPEPFNPPLGPNVGQVDETTRCLTLNSGEDPPPGCEDVAKLLRLNFDLKARLLKYQETLIEIVMNDSGDRPDYVSGADWNDWKKRCRVIDNLPDAPSEVKHAVAGLKTIHQLMQSIVAIGELSVNSQHALCWAIDLGLIMQQCVAQVLFDERKAESARNANSSKSQTKEEKSRLAEVEFRRRMAGSVNRRMKTATLQNMARETNLDGSLKYGSFSALKRYATTWKSLTPSE